MDKKKIVTSEENLNTSNKAKTILKRLSLTALAALIITTNSYSDKNIVKAEEGFELWEDGGVFVPTEQEVSETENVVDMETENLIEEIAESEVQSEIQETEKQQETEVQIIKTASEIAASYEVKNYGDPTDDNQVAEKAQKVVDYFEETGVINSYTYQPYTVEEVSDIIKYMNGAYVPENEEDAFYMVDKFLEFTCGPLSSIPTIDIVNYMANTGAVTKEMVEQDFECYTQIDWTDALLMGDSHCYPYLEWFSKKYNEMMTTTDRELFISIYNELTQSIADICYGDGFIIDGATYDIDELHGLNRLNDASVFHFFGLLYQVGYVEGVKTEYEVSSREAGEAIVYIDDILRLLNVECAEDLAEKAEYDTEGYVIYPADGNLDNPFMRWETDLINKARENSRDKQLSLSK